MTVLTFAVLALSIAVGLVYWVIYNQTRVNNYLMDAVTVLQQEVARIGLDLDSHKPLLSHNIETADSLLSNELEKTDPNNGKTRVFHNTPNMLFNGVDMDEEI